MDKKKIEALMKKRNPMERKTVKPVDIFNPKPAKQQTSKTVNNKNSKPAKQENVKTVKSEDSKTVNHQTIKQPEDKQTKELIKYTTYLPEELIIKIKIHGALKKKKGYQIIQEALENFFNKEEAKKGVGKL